MRLVVVFTGCSKPLASKLDDRHSSWEKKKQAVQVSTSQPAIFQEVGINKLVTAMGTHNFPSFLGASYNPYIGGCNTFIFP